MLYLEGLNGRRVEDANPVMKLLRERLERLNGSIERLYDLCAADCGGAVALPFHSPSHHEYSVDGFTALLVKSGEFAHVGSRSLRFRGVRIQARDEFGRRITKRLKIIGRLEVNLSA